MQFGSFFNKTIPPKNDSQQSGQTLIFFALLVPLLILFAGFGMDLGWYYLNVSRLQNAADAAVLAGAKGLLEELKKNNSKYKSYKVTLVYQHPDDNNLYTVSSLTKNSTESDTEITTDIKSTADNIAIQYVRKNLSSGNVSSFSPSFFSVAEAADTDESYSLEDSWARRNKYNEVKMKSPKIYKDGDDFYYVVHLQEDVQHFFLPGGFDPMDAPVVAVAKISKTTSSSGGTPKVVFDANGGQINKSDGGSTSMAELGELDEKFPVTIKLPSGYEQIPTREGYNFKGWSLKADGSGKNVYGTDIYTEGDLEAFFKAYDSNSNNAGYDYKKDGIVTLYAVWVKVQEPKQPKVIFDANGGRYSDGTDEASKNFKAASEMEDDEVSEPLTSSKGVPTNGSKEFKGWSKVQNPKDGDIIDIYLDGDQLSKEQVEKLFGDSDEVTLYAVWEDVRPNNNRTLWEQMQYLIAKNVYNYYWYASTAKYNADPITDAFRYPKLYYKGVWRDEYTEEIQHGNRERWQDSNGSWHKGGKEYKYHEAGWEKTTERAYYAEYLDLKTVDKKSRTIEDHYYIDFLNTETHPNFINENDTNINKTEKDNGAYGKYSRIHSLFNVNVTFPVRDSHKSSDGKKIDDDPLYFRIEAEPYKTENTPVRQIIININQSNMADNLRPLFFYYDGPDPHGDTSGRLAPEDAQPVILNLNADFKGVLFMPDIPVVINGNGHKFEGFIVAKKYLYLDTTTGQQVQYSSTGKTDQTYSDNKIRVYTDNTNGHLSGDVRTKTVDKTEAMDIWGLNNVNTFNLSSDSKFRTFKADTGVNFTYVYYGYDNDVTMDEKPFHEYSDINNELVPLYRLNASGEQVRVTKWDDVNLYNSDDFEKRKLIPKKLYNTSKKGIVRLDNGNPAPVYDEAGNPVYYCESYVKVTGSYDVFTINRVDDHTRDPKEFLLTSDTTHISSSDNVSDTDDWK